MKFIGSFRLIIRLYVQFRIDVLQNVLVTAGLRFTYLDTVSACEDLSRSCQRTDFDMDTVRSSGGTTLRSLMEAFDRQAQAFQRLLLDIRRTK